MSRLAKHTIVNSLALLLLLAFATSANSSPQTQTQTTLEPGKAIEQTIAFGETNSYQLTLSAGTCGVVEVEQKSINLIITIFTPDGQKLRRSDLNSVGAPEKLLLVAERTTTYRVDVNVSGKPPRPGVYAIKFNEPRPATDQDRARAEAEKLSEDGMQLLVTATGESRKEALIKFQQSIERWRAAKDQSGEAQAFYYVSYTLNVLSQYAKAAEIAEQGIPLAKASGNQSAHAYLLDELGTSYNNRGQRKKALDFFLQALPLRSPADPVGLGNTLTNMGIAYAWMGERTKALSYMEQVIPTMLEAGDRLKASTIIGNMCVINTDLGRYKKALELCNQAEEIKRDLQDTSGLGTVFNNLGNIYANTGDYQKALDFYQQSRALNKSVGQREGEGIAINNIGWTYAQVGEFEKAIDFYMRELPGFRERGNNYGTATLLNNIASSYAKLNDHRKALEIHLEALALRSEKDDRNGRAITLHNLAATYAKLGDKQKALESYTEALALHRTAQNERQLAITLKNFGVFYRDEGQTTKALELLTEARTISARIGDRSTEASVLSELAQLERTRGDLVVARKLIDEAIAAIESVRNNLKSHQLRTSYLASVRKYYEFEIETLMQLHQQRPAEGFAAAALQVSERSRARSLLDLLHEARAEIRQGVDPSLIRREGELRRNIAEKAEQQTRLLSAKYTEEQASVLAKEIDSLTTEFDQVQARIRQISPRYAALIEPSPIGVDAIQKQVLDENTLLLEYTLGDEKSFVWVVTPDSVKSFILPGRAAIEPEAKQFYQLLTARSTAVPGETLEQRKQRLDQAEVQYPAVAASLSRLLLAPVAAELKQKRLIVVAEGVLQYVPFSALPSPGVATARPLIVDHEIVTLPSASVLALLRDESANHKAASKGVAVLADPVFSASDSRLAFGHKPSATDDGSSAVEVQRSASESGLAALARLRFSRQEAEEIARLSGDKRDLKALDFLASRNTATDASLSDYRIVHFATHGLINNQHPDLTGIVLSLVDERGRPQNGFLRLYDIYNLKLNADLVVLSACQTALGKEIKGEGLVGLTRGFMYAGAPRVVASFWRIDDRATGEMMRRFYESMLKDGLRPAAALRAAQVSMLNDRRWQSPHFWAAFTIQGEWR